MSHQVIQTDRAPLAIGTYSQAIKAGNMVYLSGQIPLVPETMKLAEGGMEVQIRQVLENLKAVAEAAGGNLSQIVKLNVYLTDLTHFSLINTAMTKYFHPPYPARAVIGVASLPKDSAVEMDAIIHLNH
ncbi:endoribonuclease L-PSP [Candidatus Nitrosoglobus terrae]|uniref:Endoribonuclease L-PSP n=1 Tax=Candidatus Nitrosoglobus terrae TaxID=1630141 RepID=A0A1Q2SLE1_9GAMM|nr:RidA family protein [Candidatus Nitrosoglobus terrae]BAW79966.1 endoribonuclease L-PSP [Candidatus Nitrosoglobus terrae]